MNLYSLILDNESEEIHITRNLTTTIGGITAVFGDLIADLKNVTRTEIEKIVSKCKGNDWPLWAEFWESKLTQ